MSWSHRRVTEIACALKAMSSEDADSGMRAYVRNIASRFNGVELENRIKIYEELYQGHLTDFGGK